MIQINPHPAPVIAARIQMRPIVPDRYRPIPLHGEILPITVAASSHSHRRSPSPPLLRKIDLRIFARARDALRTPPVILRRVISQALIYIAPSHIQRAGRHRHQSHSYGRVQYQCTRRRLQHIHQPKTVIPSRRSVAVQHQTVDPALSQRKWTIVRIRIAIEHSGPARTEQLHSNGIKISVQRIVIKPLPRYSIKCINRLISSLVERSCNRRS